MANPAGLQTASLSKPAKSWTTEFNEYCDLTAATIASLKINQESTLGKVCKVVAMIIASLGLLPVCLVSSLFQWLKDRVSSRSETTSNQPNASNHQLQQNRSISDEESDDEKEINNQTQKVASFHETNSTASTNPANKGGTKQT